MAQLSPMMQQYKQIKAENEDSIVFFRVGDFYEMFFEDAKKASEELDLVLTGKECGLPERAPMCGVPFHSCDSYIAKLIDKGFKVSICEQTEDPATAKGLVKREIIRTITPGTVLEDNMLDEGKNNYLASIVITNQDIGVCFTDASTGECHATVLSNDDFQTKIIDELSRFSPREILLSNDFCLKAPIVEEFLKSNFYGVVTLREDSCFDCEVTEALIMKHFSVVSVENLGLESGSSISAAFGAILDYLYETGINGQISVNEIDIYTDSQYMRLDITAARNLELCETMRTKSKKGSLLWVIDKTKTPMGKRLIRNWLLQPLINITTINSRLNAVEELVSNVILRGEVVEALYGIRDIERIMTKIVYGTANAKDLLNLAATSQKLPAIKILLENVNSKKLQSIYNNIDVLDDIFNLIEVSINPEAPATLREGGLIKDGYNNLVDTLRNDMKNGTSVLAEIEAREKERTGIKNLRVRYNKVFGYYIEVTNSFLDLVPEDYIRKQTLTNAERFITEELKEIEKRVLTAKDRIVQVEYEIFDSIRKQVASEVKRVQRTAVAIAELDSLTSMAVVSAENHYCRPLVNNSGKISIKSGRHPVVEQMINIPFVANDTFLDMQDCRSAIITGPNMAGKSTYMRQTALITLMAQIGCFVPAEIAEIGIVDAIFTRVGASDDLASGQSTFMVEMSEVAAILKNATKNSLLILDEIGRGTSTFDGMSIARAVLEYVADKRKLGAKALFATHYHELTAMEEQLSGVKNFNIAVKKRGDDITFLRRIVPGGADRSYGIEVAKLSGIPNSVIERAKDILKQTEQEGVVTYKTVANDDAQMSISMQSGQDIIKELNAIDVNTLTPIEAMQILFDICNRSKNL
ncbi:MAG: DNA mismatch repair protein MutS [Ruminococcaceae bacterium]|nr:DNA mismatch repair protein MutS [Oscillospiraceae bacterium]